MATSLKYLSAPLDVGPFELRNRIISTAHTTVYNLDGLISDQEIAYHLSKARGHCAQRDRVDRGASVRRRTADARVGQF